MPQPVDPIKLKASAEHLEWVLNQYPQSDDVQALYRALLPLIEKAKAGDVVEAVDGQRIPGAWNFGEGRYIAFQSPSVDSAYADFATELEGGWTPEEKEVISQLGAERKKLEGFQS